MFGKYHDRASADKQKGTEVPFAFVLEKLEARSPLVRPMFGCHAIYLEERIVLILRQKKDEQYDNGVWLATSPEHHESLLKIFPCMRSIRLMGTSMSSWQNIPADADDFEECVVKACELILKNDARIGKIAGARKQRSIKAD